MNADDYFADCTADLDDAVDDFRMQLSFDGDAPSKSDQNLIRGAWDKLKSRYEHWLEALHELG